MDEYKITEQQCRENINGICPQCGGELSPLETVDNGGSPTYWCGCLVCERFTSGTTKEIYVIATQMVTERYFRPYSHISEGPDDTEDEKLHKQQRQINGACDVVASVLAIKKELDQPAPPTTEAKQITETG